MLRLIERMIYPLAFLAGVIGLVYWYWTTTPSYAVNCVFDSLQHHDVQAFEKYVDIDSVASHAFDDVVDGPAMGELVGRRDMLIGGGFVRFFKRDIIGLAHDRLCSMVGDQNIDFQSATAGTMESLRRYRISPKVRQALVDYGLTKDGFKGIKYLNIEGSNASLGLEFYSPRLRTNFIVELKMEDAGGYWRITQLANLNDLVNRYLRTRSYVTTS